jgi:carbonic anhydrase/acetyltransferase-like protein (isoleucine patch superfamily)
MDRSQRRQGRLFRPSGEPCEGRLLLSTTPSGILRGPGFFHPIQPNAPVLPLQSDSSTASFIDPSVRVFSGDRISMNSQVYVAPYATLDGTNGFIKVGKGSSILDNATIQANPTGQPGLVGVTIGDSVVVTFGATVQGPSTIGASGTAAQPTYIGPNAVIDGATIQPGAFVGALAHIGPGVTVPAGFRVLPGANVTTNAQASDPALGKVVKASSTDQDVAKQLLSDNVALAAGYTNLYQGNSATGSFGALGVLSTSGPNGTFNGNLAAVEGSSREPGSPTVKFEPSPVGPKFVGPSGKLVEGDYPRLRARVIGGVTFNEHLFEVAHMLGRSDSIRADEGQPISFASAIQLGTGVTIHAPLNGKLSVGKNFQAGDHSVILGGPGASIGDNVIVGPGAVVGSSQIGAGSTIGSGAYVAGSTLPAGSVVPAGAFLISNKLVQP